MSLDTGESVALLIAGLVAAAVTARQFATGRSYISHPAMQVSRKDDPFSFWLSVGPQSLAALVLIAAGAGGLLLR
jgi:hypothetical protein